MTMKIFEERRSIRNYLDKPVEEEKLQAVLEAARLAPSWANFQCWSFIVVKDPAARQAVSQALKHNPCQNGVAQAPVLIAACADPERSGHPNGQDYYLTDIGISMEHLMLEACSQGLGTCWVCFYKEEKLRTVLEVPEGIRIVALTPLGYPAESPGDSGRKPLEEIVYYEKYGRK